MNQRLNLALGALTAPLMLSAIYMVFMFAPTEADQGIVQRIFYFHVPCAWVAFAAFGLVAICGIFYLWLEQDMAAARLKSIEEQWGQGNTIDLLSPSVAGDDELRRHVGRLERSSASPGAAQTTTSVGPSTTGLPGRYRPGAWVVPRMSPQRSCS